MNKPLGKVNGGTLQSKVLISALDEAVYAAGKASYWLRMLRDGMVPKTWYRATRNGTKISFVYPQTKEQFDASLQALKAYVDEINEKFDLGIEYVPAKEGESA